MKRIVTIGARGIKSTDLEYRESLSRGNLVITADAVSESGAAATAAEIGDLGNYYVSLHINSS